MNVLLVSECDHRALVETRRVIDQFAERRGERCWQTPITQAGLEALHTALRKTARKNTAVACHRLSGGRMELLWIVGDRRRFNALGAVPIHRTARDVLRGDDEASFRHALFMRALVDLAGLLHDLGKAAQHFQQRLKGSSSEPQRNVIRHEWISLRLWQAFVGADDDATWIARLADASAHAEAWTTGLQRDGVDADSAPPFHAMAHAPIAQALGWLVVTHHRLPQLPRDLAKQRSEAHLLDGLSKVHPSWIEDNFYADDASGVSPVREPAYMETLWRLAEAPKPFQLETWCKRAARCARSLRRLLEQQRAPAVPLADPYLMHTARLCLMLADHGVSSESGQANDPGVLWANTTQSKGGRRHGNQTLEEHLLRVAKLGAELAHALPRAALSLPTLGHKAALSQRSGTGPFQWQDAAADVAAAQRVDTAAHGAFLINMASTGCGKTLANARVMQALADPERGMRCAFALGLRNLTLQTGRAFQQRLKLADSQLVILAGGSAHRALFEFHEAQAEASGSASAQKLIDEALHVESEAVANHHSLLRRAMADRGSRQLLQAPVLVCTVDHLIPATESSRGGRQIAPMLRLMSGDLVLDEPDDFDLKDLPALARLVHWAGLLGARVLLSSATLPPDLVHALFEAYLSGRAHYQAAHPCQRLPGCTVLWFDEFAQAAACCDDAVAMREQHQQFARQRLQNLAAAGAPRRRFRRVPLELKRDAGQAAEGFASAARSVIAELHAAHHSRDPVSRQAVSFGLLRMANIEPLVAVARALHRLGASEGLRIHLCAYHSRHPLLIRSAIEATLDAVLQRKHPDAVFKHASVRAAIDAAPNCAHVFLVLASPVAEVGRDHDYDWALVEPSSMRSLIQLAGRVRRHRSTSSSASPNVAVFSTNLRHWRHPSEPSYRWPGFEDKTHRFSKADLSTLLPWPDGEPIDASPRLLAAQPLQPRDRLADMEHARLRWTLVEPRAPAKPPYGGPPPPAMHAAHWWRKPPQQALLTTLLPQAQPFRAGSVMEELVLCTDEDGETLTPHRVNERSGERVLAKLEPALLHRLPEAELPQDRGVHSWAVPPFTDELQRVAASQGMKLPKAAELFGRVSVWPSSVGWEWHPNLGFWNRREE